jgi:iron complex transport system substrate-binding protein
LRVRGGERSVFMKNLILIVAVVVCGLKGQLFADEVTQKDVPRYISLAPSTTEILFALGLDDEIVGVSSYCNYPEKTRSKENVGDFSNPNMEKILSLKPEYVFCTGLEQAPIVSELKRQNISVYVGDPKDTRELFDSIRDIGGIIHREEAAAVLIKNMQREIEEITSKVKLIPPEKKRKVFIEIWHDPLITAGAGSFIDDVVSLAGGVNIASDTRRAYSIYSPEEVIKRNPDCIILTYMDRQKPLKLLEERFGWKDIRAVKDNRVYNDISPDILLRPGPRVTQGLREIYKRLYL